MARPKTYNRARSTARSAIVREFFDIMNEKKMVNEDIPVAAAALRMIKYDRHSPKLKTLEKMVAAVGYKLVLVPVECDE